MRIWLRVWERLTEVSTFPADLKNIHEFLKRAQKKCPQTYLCPLDFALTLFFFLISQGAKAERNIKWTILAQKVP